MGDMDMNLHINTVAENKQWFTCRQYQQAVQARKLYAMVGSPSPADFKNMVKLNLIKNCPITAEGIKNADIIFGKYLGSIKGKTTRKTPKPVVHDYIHVPPELLELHHDVILSMDIMFVNKLLFLTSVTKNIKFTTVQKLGSRAIKNIYLTELRISLTSTPSVISKL
eukprot:7358931-Ditylum_brightwellii.AAC.1